MVDKWNRKVTNDDIVYVLGDFSIDKKQKKYYRFLKNLMVLNIFLSEIMIVF